MPLFAGRRPTIIGSTSSKPTPAAQRIMRGNPGKASLYDMPDVGLIQRSAYAESRNLANVAAISNAMQSGSWLGTGPAS